MVRSGDSVALMSALNQANLRPDTVSTVLVISGTYTLSYDQAFPEIQSDITIRGGTKAARITSSSPWRNPILVGSGGRLRLANLEFSDFEMDGDVIINSGSLILDRVQFKGVDARPFCIRVGCRDFGRIIRNEASATVVMDRVSFVESGASKSFYPYPGSLLNNQGQAEIRNIQVYVSHYLEEVPFYNGGSLSIANATISARDGGFSRQLFLTASSGATPVLEISNSIVSGYEGTWCANAISLGHNLIENPDCDFDNEGDLTDVSADLIWAPVEADWSASSASRELVTMALVPLPHSLAVDTGSASGCDGSGLVEAVRVALDGDGDGISACDRGAVERVPSTITHGGINGLFYNPDSDGHYLYIADTAGPVMIMWTTFDANGDPAWIFGLSNRIRPNGRVVAEAYINRNGRVTADGTLRPAESQPWGTLDLRMDSCDSGRLFFDSDEPGFGRGEFNFRRLAEVDQIGCVEDQ